MSISQLKYVVSVAETGNFARAAEQCFVTQPTLSMQIKKLETRLGFALFDRSHTPTRVTAEGETLVAQAQVAVNAYEQVFEIAADLHGDLTGTLTLGIIPTVATSLVPRLLGPFRERHPKADLVIREMTTESLLQALQEDRIDAGLAATPLRAEGIHETPLYTEMFRIYASPDWKERLGPGPIDARQLAPESLYLMRDGHCFRHQSLQVCGRSDASSHSYESGSFETLVRLVDAGQGLTLLPELVVRDLESGRQDNIVSFKDPVPCREISLLHRRPAGRRRLREAVTQLIRDIVPPNLVPEDSPRRVLGPR